MVVQVRPEHVVLAWRDVGPILARAQHADQPDGRELAFAGKAQLWAVLDDSKPIAAALTQVHGDRVLVWQIAGHRLSEWAEIFVRCVTDWARSLGCTALYGAGRKGWSKVVEPMGFRRIGDIDGRPAWALEI